MARFSAVARAFVAATIAVVVSVGASIVPPTNAVGSAAPATPQPASSRVDDPIAHDPTMVKEGKYFYVVITGDIATHTYLPIKRSTDLVHWTTIGTVFAALPQWITQELGVTPGDAWAPDLNYVNGQWALYYAASQFGTQNSVIGLATTPTLDPASPNYGWVDRGMVLRSTPGVDDFNAIDPDYSIDSHGNAWLAFGSFWGGIKMRRLDVATGKLSATDTTLYPLASRVAPDAEEGASILRKGDYYYLFVSFDFCCRGVNSDYRVMVGRSSAITGPYVDAAGVRMTDGGGTEVLRGYNEFIGTGGADVYSAGVDYFVNHYYDATDDGAPKLNVRTLSWDGGWPTVSDPINPSRGIGHGDAYVSIVDRHSDLAVTDAGCGYEGANIDLEPSTAGECQQWQFYYRGGGAFSILNRFSNKVAEVGACNNVDGGNVSQWGWIGFLPNNDCQRWTPVPTSGGWTTVQSILAGSRVIDASGCGSTSGTNIDVYSQSANACQQFRFQPSGSVLIADASSSTETLGVAGCTAHYPTSNLVRYEMRNLAGCQDWVFTSAGGAAYTITNTATGQRLGTCDDGEGHGFCLVDAHGNPGADGLWTLQPSPAGAWTLTSLQTNTGAAVRLLIP
jgi:arabinan endo-1,5-alpha-L-arabinosidase